MITLRSATRADLPATAEVFRAAWRANYRGIVPDQILDALTVDNAADQLATAMRISSAQTTVAVDEHRVIGFVNYRTDHDDDPGTGYLASLYVHPSAAGKGVGAQLLLHAITAMSSQDITLWVFEANARARLLYERAGFRPDGTTRTDPRWQTPQLRYRCSRR